MPTCSRCGKKGIFLKIDPIFKRCDKCVELERKEYQIEKEKREEEEKNRIEKTRKDREYHDRLIEKAKKRE